MFKKKREVEGFGDQSQGEDFSEIGILAEAIFRLAESIDRYTEYNRAIDSGESELGEPVRSQYLDGKTMD